MIWPRMLHKCQFSFGVQWIHRYHFYSAVITLLMRTCTLSTMQNTANKGREREEAERSFYKKSIQPNKSNTAKNLYRWSFYSWRFVHFFVSIFSHAKMVVTFHFSFRDCIKESDRIIVWDTHKVITGTIILLHCCSMPRRGDFGVNIVSLLQWCM